MNFIVIIPVADRPRHIRACLDSLKATLSRFPYDGTISVLLADDSADPANVAANREIAARYGGAGFEVVHFGPDEQYALAAPLMATLPGVLGSAPRERFGHKGQGVMRNIAYLKVAQMLREGPPKLSRGDTPIIWSIDSDQEFRVDAGENDGYVVNYFNGLEAVFARTGALVVTGKVVGDPPVSPAVMTANFLADVLAFLRGMADAEPGAPCSHHTHHSRNGDAAYHDMADLFGFAATEAFDYPCPLAGPHSEADCFADFAARANSFFYGEHPTRVSRYEPLALFDSVQPARTVYAGNYAFRAEALRYFIPFAPLRLRMSGPTLGRLLRAELGPRFVSANLPMLHRRTVESGGQSEFRPGIATEARRIDLGGEFERQFQGDVMLFTIERLAADGFPREPEAGETIAATLADVRGEMLGRYQARHRDILARLAGVRAVLEDPRQWWHRSPAHAAALDRLRVFADNVEHNFGEDAPGYQKIADETTWRGWRDDLFAAIRGYRDDRRRWEAGVWPA